MSAFSCVELELIAPDLTIEAVFAMLAQGSWVDESDRHCMISANCIEFSEGFHDSSFKLTLLEGKLEIESDSPWELELLIGELKEIAVKKEGLEKINT